MNVFIEDLSLENRIYRVIEHIQQIEKCEKGEDIDSDWVNILEHDLEIMFNLHANIQEYYDASKSIKKNLKILNEKKEECLQPCDTVYEYLNSAKNYMIFLVSFVEEMHSENEIISIFDNLYVK